MSATTFDDILNCPNLPTLPAIAVEMLELTRNPNVELAEIERLVQSDPGLASKILRTINSSFYGLQAPCGSIKRALAYLGLDAVKSLVLGFSLVETTGTMQGSNGFDFKEFWRRAIYSSAGGRYFALLFHCGDPDEAFTCGMFQDIGMLATYCMLRGRYGKVIASTQNTHNRLQAAERAELGFEHAAVGAALGQKWRLPELITECIRHHHDPDAAPIQHRDLVRAVALGRMVAETLVDEDTDERLSALLQQIRQWFGPLKEDPAEMLATIRVAAHDLAAVLDQPLGDPPDIHETISRANEQISELQFQTQREVEHLQRVQQDLSIQASTDALTNIGNRASFDVLLREQFDVATATSRPLSVLFSDADRFKAVNDTHGHPVGDGVLVELARLLTKVCGEQGTPYRYGGEEFAVICPDLDRVQATALAERLRQSVGEKPFELASDDGERLMVDVTISIGVASLDPSDPDRPATPEQLVARADKAVYVAKRDGRNCVRHVADCRKANEGEFDAARVSPMTPQPGHRARHVLIIEPDALAASLLVALFRKSADVTTSWFRRPDDVLTWMDQAGHKELEGPMLAMCGCRGEMDELLRLIRVLRVTPGLEHTAVAVLTDTEDDQIATKALEAGADGCYEKCQIATRLAQWSREVLTLPPESARAA